MTADAGSREPAPLRAPDVERMAKIERLIALAEPGLVSLTNRLHSARSSWLAELDRHLDSETERRLHAEVAAAHADWSAAETPVMELRDEWMQLQVVRSFMPPCAICSDSVGPVYLEFSAADPAQALCLDCFDWTCDHDPESGRQPPSHWVEQVGGEAREREAARRLELPRERRCWHCGGSAGDLDGWEPEYATQGGVILKVAALVPACTGPELGDVCLLCVDRELDLFGRWATIERVVCDPLPRRHERAMRRFVLGSPPPPARPQPLVRSSRRTGRH